MRVWGLGIRVPGCGLVAETGRGCGVVRLGGGQAEVTDARGPLAGRVGCGSGGVRQREVATRPPAWPAPAEPKGGARLAFCWRLPRFASLLVLFACSLPARRQGCGLPLAPHQRRGAATALAISPASLVSVFVRVCAVWSARREKKEKLAFGFWRLWLWVTMHKRFSRFTVGGYWLAVNRVTVGGENYFILRLVRRNLHRLFGWISINCRSTDSHGPWGCTVSRVHSARGDTALQRFCVAFPHGF